MASRRPISDASPRLGPVLGWSGVVVALACALLYLSPPPAGLVLPALSVLLLAGGFGLAAGTWLRLLPQRLGGARSYDIAGALVFLGFAAALVGDSAQTIALLDEMQARGLTASAK